MFVYYTAERFCSRSFSQSRASGKPDRHNWITTNVVNLWNT